MPRRSRAPRLSLGRHAGPVSSLRGLCYHADSSRVTGPDGIFCPGWGSIGSGVPTRPGLIPVARGTGRSPVGRVPPLYFNTDSASTRSMSRRVQYDHYHKIRTRTVQRRTPAGIHRARTTSISRLRYTQT